MLAATVARDGKEAATEEAPLEAAAKAPAEAVGRVLLPRALVQIVGRGAAEVAVKAAAVDGATEVNVRVAPGPSKMKPEGAGGAPEVDRAPRQRRLRGGCGGTVEATKVVVAAGRLSGARAKALASSERQENRPDESGVAVEVAAAAAA